MLDLLSMKFTYFLQILKVWFLLSSVPLTIQSFTNQLAVITTEVTAIVIALAALTYAIGVALVSTPVTNFAPSLAETGTKLKVDSIKALFTIGIYGGLVNLVTWCVNLLNGIGGS